MSLCVEALTLLSSHLLTLDSLDQRQHMRLNKKRPNTHAHAHTSNLACPSLAAVNAICRGNPVYKFSPHCLEPSPSLAGLAACF